MQLTPEIIRICRTNLNMTQGHLARKVGISGALLGAIERDERHLTSSIAERVRAAFPVDDDAIAKIVEAYARLNNKMGE
ncbi:helix-turn-helix transcriptional regulator [Sporosarcina newyorkensis]|uniref:Helix-turn-helix n=1 Tax=Sporosarcina newyorkensis TaxID=759851 RepID=A0A1T4XGM6_9BACL|nr:helix-turn-helix transcriptional regulator [Sporosarcina newyorkensis]SKA88716.1 Helix-turn-helix [Sporosarcina newyorkensis]